ncbi:aminoglycoside phosphotransferase family protein [Patulibacter defluvii]|uniref:aminoglycoside phosphotransferase family protein n=1 Tax=Patulibacter defluvii TaxID=3095358 RepID=UPI002A7564F0|nr:aminoglycoside phosphotransferase family protein [Patulibacter sp. DM4]
MPPLPSPAPLDPAFRRRLLAIHGEPARAWIDELPATIEGWRTRWGLGPLRPFPLSYNWVAATVRDDDGAACVLKLSPDPEILRPEAAWLTLAEGRGACRLLESAADEGALLLEQVVPGTLLATLADVRDDEACDALGAVIGAFHRPDDGGVTFASLPTLRERVAELDDHLRAHPAGDPFPGGLVASAARVAEQLLATADGDVLLHGDLHHDNILRDDARGWLAIDPHGLRGDATYEPAAFLYNPLEHGQRVAELAAGRCRRIAAATGFDEARVRGWGFVQAVLSAVWSLDEDPRPDEHVLAVARVLAP